MTAHLHRQPTGPVPRVDRTSTVACFGPNWFASVMGTGIVAVAAAGLPVTVSGMSVFATVMWAVASALLLAVTAATVAHWIAHPAVARGHLDDPVMAHFYGAPAMALMTVGAGTLVVGHRVVGAAVALVVAWVLWTAGTALGLVTAVVVPFRAISTHRTGPESAFGGWLMPVVPPMVSAATGAALVPHLPVGQARETMLVLCLMFVGLSMLCSLVVISMIWSRLLHHGIGSPAAVPTLWIVLGPLGQSITATSLLAAAAPAVVGDEHRAVCEALALAYGIPVLGFALLWLALVGAVTARTARSGLPFSLTWWSFTFPVGTLITGTSCLTATTGNGMLALLAVVLFAALVLAWTVVATRTLGGMLSGALLRAPRQA